MSSKYKNEHKKYYNSQGIEVPSVTTILKIVNNNLDSWANYMGMKGIDSKEYANKRADYGTYIHSICEKFFNYELPKNHEDFELDERYLNRNQYISLYEKLTILRDMLRRNGYEYYASELSITEDKFGGTIDLVFYNEIDDEYIILDFKTSKKVYSKYFIQLAGYTMLFRMKYGYNIKGTGIVLIDKPINDREFLTMRSIDKNEYNVHIFTSLLNIYYSMTDKERKFYFEQ